MREMIQRFFFFLIVVTALYSCTSLAKIDIQVSVPPKYPVSSEIQSIALLNRSLTPKFANLDRDSLEKMLVKHDLDLDTLFQDSIAADTAIQTAAKVLFESGRFDAVVPEERNVWRVDLGGVLAPLDKDYIDTLCQNFNVDAILALEEFSEHLTTDFSITRYGEIYGLGRSLNEYDGVINVQYQSVWRLYQPKVSPPIRKFEISDTIFWEGRDYSLQEMYSQLPSIKEALIGGGIASGTEIASSISPTWQDEVRKYYKTGNKEADAAIPLFRENKWEEAAELWMKYSGASSKTLRSRIEFNLALAAEMNGDLNLAIDWLSKSIKTKYSGTANLYLNWLKKRQKTEGS